MYSFIFLRSFLPYFANINSFHFLFFYLTVIYIYIYTKLLHLLPPSIFLLFLCLPFYSSFPSQLFIRVSIFLRSSLLYIPSFLIPYSTPFLSFIIYSPLPFLIFPSMFNFFFHFLIISFL